MSLIGFTRLSDTVCSAYSLMLTTIALLTLRISYFPGWDCHGLPIENKVLKELGVSKVCHLYTLLVLMVVEERPERYLPGWNQSGSRGLCEKSSAKPIESI